MDDVSDSVKSELKKLNNAIENTKMLAEDNGGYDYGTKWSMDPEYSFVEGWSVSNCGEVWSARDAILNGAKFDELSYYTVKEFLKIFVKTVNIHWNPIKMCS